MTLMPKYYSQYKENKTCGEILLAQQVTFQNNAFVNVCFFVSWVFLTISTFYTKTSIIHAQNSTFWSFLKKEFQGLFKNVLKFTF